MNLRRFPWLPRALAPATIGILENPGFKPDAVAAWGAKTSAAYARFHARVRGLPFITLEDGFYRSVGLGKAGAMPLSLTLDTRGAYFDSRQSSDLEILLAGPLDHTVTSRGAQLRTFVLEWRLSKYNHLPEVPIQLTAPSGTRRILLVDQVAGDRSLVGAGANLMTFAHMRRETEALAREGAASIFFRPHPDVVAGFAKGMLGAPDSFMRSVPECGPHALLDEIDEVWTASSQLGFDALLKGREVTVFAASFYAGWGLTRDRLEAAAPHVHTAMARRASRLSLQGALTLDALAGAAIGLYPRYYDPVVDRAVDAEAALERLSLWRDHYHAR